MVKGRKQTLRIGVGHSEADLFFFWGLKLKNPRGLHSENGGWVFFSAGKKRRFRTKGLPTRLNIFIDFKEFFRFIQQGKNGKFWSVPTMTRETCWGTQEYTYINMSFLFGNTSTKGYEESI